MVSFIIAILLVTGGQEPQPKESEPARPDPLAEQVLGGIAYYVSSGILVDLDSLAAVRVPGASALPIEVLRALQGNDQQKRKIALACLGVLAQMAQTGEGKSDGARRFRLALGRLAASYESSFKSSLKDADAEVRFVAGASLLVLEPNHAGALQAVLAGLRIMDPRYLEMVGRLRLTHEPIVACLAGALGQKDPTCRRAAARALMEIGRPARAAVPALVKLLKSKEAIDKDFVPWMCITVPSRMNLAVEALRVMAADSAPAVPTLTEMLQSCDDHECREILACLASIGPPARAAATPVRKILRERGEGSAPANLLCRSELDIRLGAACTLLRIFPGDKEAFSTIRNGLRTSDKAQRLLTFRACAEIGLREKALVPDLIRGLNDEALKESAACALAQFGSDAKDAIPTLLEILLKERHDQVWANAVAYALARIGKASVPGLIKAALQQEGDPREAALLALGSLEGETHRTMPVLINALVDYEYRSTAAIALGKLGSAARDARALLFVVYLLDLLRPEEELLLMERWALQQVWQ
jgi:HEAT repeat protein